MAAKAKAGPPAAKIEQYEKLLRATLKIERKGDTNPYTSLNGHMFTHLTPEGTLAIRLPEADLKAFLQRYKARLFESYGVVKKDWAVVPDSLLAKTKEMKPYLEASLRYVKTLKPKPAAKKR